MSGRVIYLRKDDRIRVRRHGAHVDSFMSAIFPAGVAAFLLTDDSTLLDFVPIPGRTITHVGDIQDHLDRYAQMGAVLERIKQLYNVDAPNGIHSTIAEILDQIHPHT